ncbi:MAG: energy-coupling factor transporter ATPase [Candidatus Izemoplasmatales bacterium]|nr:energy-coupling factor transporter ATPase [Candidatus Izemoplasmatales bacterium]
MSKLEINDLSFTYTGKRMILKNIQLQIQKGEWVAILGHNGSGKSTLAKCIVGLLEPQSGSVVVDDMVLSHKTAYEIRKKIGIVFQNPDNQFVGVTVRDDIAFGMENLGIPKDQMISSIDFYAEKVGVKEMLDKEPSTLSGGQKQRVAIAGILAMHTDVMVFDEATSMLDPYARNELMQYIQELHQEGMTILMITHDIEEALYADRIVVLKGGEVHLDASKEEALRQTERMTEAGLELPVSLRILNGVTNLDPSWKEYLWASTFDK